MFEGVSTALVTPFRDGVVDEHALDALVEAHDQAEQELNGKVANPTLIEIARTTLREWRAKL